MLTGQDNVGHVVAPVSSPTTTTAASVVLVLVVEELLVLQVQTRLAVGEQLTPVRHAPLVVCQELRRQQGSRLRPRGYRVRLGSQRGSEVKGQVSQSQVWRSCRGSQDHCRGQSQVSWPHPSRRSDNDVSTHRLRGLSSQLQAQVGVIQQRVEEGVLQGKGHT